jgi:hypothetical protein
MKSSTSVTEQGRTEQAERHEESKEEEQGIADNHDPPRVLRPEQSQSPGSSDAALSVMVSGFYRSLLSVPAVSSSVSSDFSLAFRVSLP